jgi:putative ABC transport system permease protein
MATTLPNYHLTIAEPAVVEIPILEPLEAGGASLNLWEVMRIAFDSLLANKLRSLLTMLGIIIGVGSVVALMALGNGATASITNEIQGIGTNILAVVPSSPGNRGPGQGGPSQSLTLDDARAIAALRLPVNGVAPQFGASGQLVAPAADINASIQGVTADYRVVNNLQVASGSFIEENQVSGVEPVVVLGANVATQLFGSGQAVGQVVRVKGQALLVVGVLVAKGGSGFSSVDDQAFVPITTAQQRLFGGRTPDGNGYRVSSIALSALNSGDVEAIQGRIRLLLRDRHHLAADGSEDDFDVISQAEFLDALTTVTTVLTAFLAAVGGISLLVGGIGIMNIMLVSVTERTREIGLRKAVGARPRDILLQFVVEALVLSLIGGLIGLGLGSLVAYLVTLSELMTAVVTPGAVALAVGFSMAVGLFFGIYPAQRAARLNPIDALRHE